MAPRYGRGTFTAHPNYIKYMEDIVKDPNFSDMPNAINPENNKINWQVSSGKSTSFYEYYLARYSWWVKKADELKVPGNGNSQDRFSITARIINPFGKKPCRLCGKDWYIGYMYLNALLAKRWNRLTNSQLFTKGDLVINAAILLIDSIGIAKVYDEFLYVFPEKSDNLPNQLTATLLREFFRSTMHIKGRYLSPGYMANPPDRLDGFHDYCLTCRPDKDPGRSDENMRSYNHDRRAFMWWAEGDWVVADALYNLAGHGICAGCGKTVDKVSPDHVGPLACGFKQIPLFEPLCASCNSSKNRRFTYENVQTLIRYENQKKESVASWQVKSLWDNTKHLITNDSSAKELSNVMRGLQDFYLRYLHSLYNDGHALFLINFLTPENAFFKVFFEELNPQTFEFKSFTKLEEKTILRQGLAARVIRIAFEELSNYVEKEAKSRKVQRFQFDAIDLKVSDIAALYQLSDAKNWNDILKSNDLLNEEKEKEIIKLMTPGYKAQDRYVKFKGKVIELFDSLGTLLAEDAKQRLT